MKIKIDEKILCFPPYISTTWDQVRSLRVEPDGKGGDFLVITLSDGYKVIIPRLDIQFLHVIFASHLRYLSQKTEAPQTPLPFMRLSLGGLESLGGLLQHNQTAANTPPLPPEILEKVAGLAKSLGMEELSILPKAEPHCNCTHCQIARAMHGEPTEPEVIPEEPVSDEELRFRLWDVESNGDQLYTVRNASDPKEHYSVFLGDPMGCTCGQKGCDHIQAVLRT